MTKRESFAATDSSQHQVVFIDAGVEDYETLLSDVAPGAEVVVIDPNADGVRQIAEHL